VIYITPQCFRERQLFAEKQAQEKKSRNNATMHQVWGSFEAAGDYASL
jgi:hypothetical protein